VKTCFNQATTLNNSTLLKDLELCEKHGYDYIEIRLDKLREYLQMYTVKELMDFFEKSHLKPYAFNALEFIIFRDEVGYAQILADLRFLCETGAKINCHKIVVVPTFDVGDKTLTEIATESVNRLRELGAIAAGYNVDLAFEFVGYPNCSVNCFEEAYKIVEQVGLNNVGIVLDCFHFHAMKSKIAALKTADPKKIFVFHLDDCEDLPHGWLRDNHRVWPGAGAVDLEAIFGALKEIGYSEMASIELFRPEYWELDAEQTIALGKRYTDDMITRYMTK
jgi:2-keto-myo-inositol isomerase